MSKPTRFGQRFRVCRIIAGYNTLQQASDATGISTGALSDYENDNRLPLVPALEAMADAYDVSTDFLLGRTNETEHAGHTINI